MLKNEVKYFKDHIVFLRHNSQHRKDGPAIMWLDGYRSYWEYGKKHRRDGPALIRSDDSTPDYFLRGIFKR